MGGDEWDDIRSVPQCMALAFAVGRGREEGVWHLPCCPHLSGILTYCCCRRVLTRCLAKAVGGRISRRLCGAST